MKKVPWLTAFLVLGLFGVAVAAPAPVQDKCKCNNLRLVATGKVSWFCCLMPDFSAKVKLVGYQNKIYGSAVTSASGAYRIKATVKMAKCGPKNCCVFVDMLHIESANCFAGVLGLKGKSREAEALVINACQKAISLTMPEFCEQFTQCLD